MKNRHLFTFLIILGANLSVAAQKNAFLPLSYNLVWNSQSKNSSESMPCGGGSIGLNVWVENNDLLLYISKSDAFEENNTLNKLGRMRVSLSPNPFESASFKQELKLNEGYITVTAIKGSEKTELNIWVDVFRPVVHVDMESSLPRTLTASYESWRNETFKLRTDESFQGSYKWAPFDTIYMYKDSISFQNNTVSFFHRNRNNTVFDANVKLQGLEGVKSELYNPLKNNTYGGVMSGSDMIAAGNTSGKYVDTDYKGWSLKSKKPVRKQSIEVSLYTRQTATLGEWQDGLAKVVADARANAKTARKQTLDWWLQFWNLSHIVINASEPDTANVAWQVGRNYQLFRYMLGCNAYGTYPTKFNGGLFTVDPVFTDKNKHFTPDFRNWCGGTMTAQNQRLVYFPMLKSGDFDMMKPQFDFYERMRPNTELRSEVCWGHKGAGFTEQIESYGLSNPAEYSWNHPADYDKGYDYNAFLEYLWDTSLEFCFMILENQRYASKDITEYMPLIESCLTFYNEHYRYMARKRGINELDGNGKLILYPSSGAETFKMAYNSTSTIMALKTVLTHLLALPDTYLTADKRKMWKDMLNRIPNISYTQYNGHVTIAPAQAYERVQNEESPQLYTVFPWDMFSVGKPGLDTALNTWKYDPFVKKFRSHVGWKQDVIWAARLGLVDDAKTLCQKKLGNSGRRCPAFWGPGFDWTPDHNWGGSGMIGLQEMVMQTTDDKIYILPTWPSDWDVDFKLNAPKNTVVECVVKKGKIEKLTVTPAERQKDVVVMLK